jgi:hypothetical protein
MSIKDILQQHYSTIEAYQTLLNMKLNDIEAVNNTLQQMLLNTNTRYTIDEYEDAINDIELFITNSLPIKLLMDSYGYTIEQLTGNNVAEF